MVSIEITNPTQSHPSHSHKQQNNSLVPSFFKRTTSKLFLRGFSRLTSTRMSGKARPSSWLTASALRPKTRQLLLSVLKKKRKKHFNTIEWIWNIIWKSLWNLKRTRLPPYLKVHLIFLFLFRNKNFFIWRWHNYLLYTRPWN